MRTAEQRAASIEKTRATRSCPKCGLTLNTVTGAFKVHVKWCGQDENARFWAKVQRGEGCWPWTGAKHRDGYGRAHMRLGGTEMRMRIAHRVAYLLGNGPIADGMDVCHSCDNPICCNPSHLWLGTARDNGQDASRKGRQRSGTAKLTPNQVREIRKEYKRHGAHNQTNCRELAARYEVSMAVIWRAASGNGWKSVK